MQKDVESEKKKKKNPSEPKPEGLQEKAIKCNKDAGSQKTKKKIHRSLNRSALNQRQ